MARLPFEKFMAKPDTKPASEWACGKVAQKPMPDLPHSALQMYLGFMLYGYLARTGLGRVLSELRCIFGPPDDVRIYVPDLLYVSNAHPLDSLYLYAAPELVIEVLSPEQHMREMREKIRFCLANGVQMVWVLDPDARSLTVERPNAEPQLLRAGDTLDGGDVLPEFSLSVADIFAQIPG